MNSTLFFSHPDCQLHDMGNFHPESPDRLRMIDQMVKSKNWEGKLTFLEAPKINTDNFNNVHPRHYVEALLAQSPMEGVVNLGPDISLNPFSINASFYAAGAAIQATDEVIAKRATNAFCAVRPVRAMMT